MKLPGGLDVKRAEGLVQSEAGRGCEVKVVKTAYDPVQDVYFVEWTDGKALEKYQALVSDPSDPDAAKKAAEAKPGNRFAAVWFNEGSDLGAVALLSDDDATRMCKEAAESLLQAAKAA